MSQKKKSASSGTGATKKRQQTPAESAKDTPANIPQAPASEPFEGLQNVPPPAPDRNGKAAKPTKRSKPQPKLSALEAAAKLLQEVGQPLSCPEMIVAMAEKGYWTSPPRAERAVEVEEDVAAGGGGGHAGDCRGSMPRARLAGKSLEVPSCFFEVGLPKEGPGSSVGGLHVSDRIFLETKPPIR